jgi:hypothetical protein
MAVHVDARGGPHLAQEGRGGLSGAVSVSLPHLALPGFQVDRRVLDDLRLQAWARRLAALQQTGGRTARRRSPALRFVRDAPRRAPVVNVPVILAVDSEAVDTGVQRVLARQVGARELLQDATRELQTALNEALPGT